MRMNRSFSSPALRAIDPSSLVLQSWLRGSSGGGAEAAMGKMGWRRPAALRAQCADGAGCGRPWSGLYCAQPCRLPAAAGALQPGLKPSNSWADSLGARSGLEPYKYNFFSKMKPNQYVSCISAIYLYVADRAQPPEIVEPLPLRHFDSISHLPKELIRLTLATPYRITKDTPFICRKNGF